MSFRLLLSFLEKLTKERKNGVNQTEYEIEDGRQEVLTLHSGRCSDDCDEPDEGDEECSDASELHVY